MQDLARPPPKLTPAFDRAQSGAGWSPRRALVTRVAIDACMPSQPVGLAYRVFAFAISLIVASHLLIHSFPGLVLGTGRGAVLHATALGKYAYAFAWLEVAARLHPMFAAAAVIAPLVAFFWMYRRWVTVWDAPLHPTIP